QWLLETKDLLWGHSANWRQLRRFHWRQRYHQYGFRLMERRRVVELEIQVFVFTHCESGNVLVRGGMEIAHDSRKVDDGSDVGAVVTTTSQSCIANLSDQF